MLRLLLLKRSLAASRSTEKSNLSLCLPKQNSILFTSPAFEDAVHLLERSVFGLGQEEPNPQNTSEQEDGEEDIGPPLPSLEHGRNEESNGKVVDPVA